eukprot:TRINITY_DN10_c0_g1_i4.p2 TRINITY_DN10_c0_g1~~TRINITY_DN10_c0_g1_i4.p2  ORF type:complete len:1217 (-),score=333.96 TRINITY_DN10_c0_g1_i4:19942-23592(-)
MKTIGELLTRDLTRKIEEIIKVDQADQDSVYSEITEYIATDSIKDHYNTLFKAIAETPADPHEDIGVWVSGFFGSGKSSFAKNLGYALQNRKVLNQDFSTLFKKQLDDHRVGDLLDSINARFPTEVVLFEVAKERDTRKVTERIAELMYTVLLRELDYAEDFDVAELEIELEAEGKLDHFKEVCLKLHKRDWSMVRKGAQRLSRASAVLHDIEPKTYPSADSWSHAQKNQETAITVTKMVERTFELWGRRRKGKALIFIIDEVGQHVARSGDKIEDLRATVEEFGKVGKNLMKARKIVAPCWIVVTSQEKLDEVVAAIDSKRVDLAKLQDRFHYRVDLAPSDIREVATKRVLAKTKESEPILKALFNKNPASLNAALRLERTTRRTEVNEADFVQFYPYPPHYVDLCINIMSGVRLQPGAPRHYGGSNRTIIKQAYEMLVSERTDMAHKPIGTLVTLDKVYELVEGNLSNEKRTDIHEISERFKNDADDQGWALRVAKVICLLEFVRDLPRTEANIASFLVDDVGKHAPLKEAQAAVKRLHAAQFIRSTEEGWKLQTAQEKNWETERRGYLEPKPRERNEISRQSLEEIFGEPALKTYRYKDHKTFRLGISVDGAVIGDEGDLTLSLCIADDSDDFNKRLGEVRDDSRQPSHTNDLYWVCSLTPEIDDLVKEVFASRKMVEKYDQMRAQNKITTDEATCLQDEKNSFLNYRSRLRDKLSEGLEKGTGMFRGVASDAASLGKNLSEIIKKLLSKVVPDLYPKLEMGSRSLKGDEAELLLKAANLQALPQVFYAGDNGLGLVVKDGAKFVPNPAADVAKEVLDYLVSEHSYGNKDTRLGKALEKRFGGIGYGWDRDMLRLILTVLFRAGAIEVTHGGQKFDSYQDPACRVPFTNNTAFKSALFTPVKPIDLKTLKRAVESFEDLTGETVAMDKSAIADALKKLAVDELKALYPVELQAKSHQLPIQTIVEEYKDTLTAIEGGSADDCVNTLAGAGTSLKEARERIRKVSGCLNEKGLATIRQARQAVDQMWPQLQSRGQTELAEQVEELRGLLGSETFYESFNQIGVTAKSITSAYRALYEQLHADRSEQFTQAVEKIKGRAEWNAVPDSMRDPVLNPLTARCCPELDLSAGSLVCQKCHATLSQMESDVAALGGLFANVVAQIQKLTTPPEVKLQRVRISDFFTHAIENETDVKEAVNRLQDHLLKLLDEGVKIVVE